MTLGGSKVGTVATKGTGGALAGQANAGPVAGCLLMPVFIELYRRIHGRIELLANRNANRRRSGVQHTPQIARWEHLHGALERLPRLGSRPSHLVGMLQPGRRRRGVGANGDEG